MIAPAPALEGACSDEAEHVPNAGYAAKTFHQL